MRFQCTRAPKSKVSRVSSAHICWKRNLWSCLRGGGCGKNVWFPGIRLSHLGCEECCQPLLQCLHLLATNLKEPTLVPQLSLIRGLNRRDRHDGVWIIECRTCGPKHALLHGFPLSISISISISIYACNLIWWAVLGFQDGMKQRGNKERRGEIGETRGKWQRSWEWRNQTYNKNCHDFVAVFVGHFSL